MDGPTDGQMGQCHKDIIIYIGEWRTMWESSQSRKHVTCLGMGLMGTFSGPKSLAVQIFFNTLWAGLTNPRDILDSFNENPLVPAPLAPWLPAPALAPKKQPAALPPAPPQARVPIQAPALPVSHPAPPPVPRQPPAVPRHPQPVDTRQLWATEDVEMRDVSRRPPPPAPCDIPQTLPHDPPLHVSKKKKLGEGTRAHLTVRNFILDQH